MIVGRWLRTLVAGFEIMLVLAVAPALAAGEIRTWRDESGKFEVRAELLDFDGEKVRLAKEDGKEITVPLSRLCAADRAHVRRVMKNNDDTSKDGAGKSGPDRSGKSAADDAEEEADGEAGEAGAKQANVDLATQFTDLMVTQRGYQANAKIITTSDEILQELINLKR